MCSQLKTENCIVRNSRTFRIQLKCLLEKFLEELNFEAPIKTANQNTMYCEWAKLHLTSCCCFSVIILSVEYNYTYNLDKLVRY